MPVRRCDGTTARAAGSDDARRVVARVVAQAEARAEVARAGPEDALAGGAVAVAALRQRREVQQSAYTAGGREERSRDGREARRRWQRAHVARCPRAPVRLP